MIPDGSWRARFLHGRPGNPYREPVMESEIERLRLRVRQLERELRALRSAVRDGDGTEPSPAVVFPPAAALRRWSSAAPAHRAPEPGRP